MSFDPSKVKFTQEELDAAAAADIVFELLRDELEDGFQAADLIKILSGSLPSVIKLFEYLKSDAALEYADKLVALGVMLARDNDWLDAPKQP